ncbi:hypothetical protein [Streptomyces zaomyceticus]|uniref:hypothetical protein n=1 Tax=Streptomyces zaomyceticus TaxID=68286 RepID=UPI0036C19642
MAPLRAALVTATALVVGVVPTASAAAAPAPTEAVGTVAASGTVVQEGGPLVVPVGEEAPVTTRFTITLPASVTGRVTLGLRVPMPLPSAGDNNLPSATCSVNGGAYQSCGWGYENAEQNDSWNDGYSLSLPPTEAARTLTYDLRIDTSRWILIGERAGTLEMKDARGNVVASGPAALHFVPGTPEPGDRATVHARDKGGVLWQYEATSDPARPFKARTRVGGGWNAYTAITKLSPTVAAGWGSLVARDKAGVLWYYEGTGNPARPFKARARVGGGWNTYTSITGTRGNLVARDRDGVLWSYDTKTYWDDAPAMFKPRVRVGGGWNAYNLVTNLADRVVARDASGVLWSYEQRSELWDPWDAKAPFKPRVRVGGGWNAYTAVTETGEMTKRLTWRGDGIARDRDGRLWLYHATPHAARTQIGRGWNIYTAIV